MEQAASMRPPEFTGGNIVNMEVYPSGTSGFNEAAGIHRRKRYMREVSGFGS